MKKCLFILLAILVCSPAFASVGFRDAGANPDAVADIDCYPGSACSAANGVGTIDNRIAGITSGTINGATIGATTPANLNYLRPVVVISATSSTLSTVGAYTGSNSIAAVANSGSIFVFPGFAGVAGAPVISLPGTYTTVSGSLTGLAYTFSSGTGTSIVVRTGSATDATILYGGGPGLGTTTRITSPASSGSTVTVVGSGSGWYVAAMGGGAISGTNWTPGTF